MRSDEAILLHSSELIVGLLSAIQTDCFYNVQRDATDGLSKTGSPLSRAKSTVGLMLNDLTVHNMVVGGPAFNCGQIRAGDRIVKVDGKPVCLDDFEAALKGSDIPGTEVVITLYRESEGAEKEVALRRMARTAIADLVMMFEIFTRMEGLAADCGNPELTACTEDAVRLWTKMQVASGSQEKRIEARIKEMQDECKNKLVALRGNIEALRREDKKIGSLPPPSLNNADDNKLSTIHETNIPRREDHSMQELMETCESICTTLKAEISADLLSVKPSKHRLDLPSRGTTDGVLATVGLVTQGLVVENMVVGGPAYTCAELDRGDIVTKVDGIDVTEETFPRAVIGVDLPGSEVTLTVMKNSTKTEREIILRRMAREVMAEYTRMFDLFINVKEGALVAADEEGAECIDACISHWTRMLLSSASQEEKISRNVQRVQASAAEDLLRLQHCLRQVTSLQDKQIRQTTCETMRKILMRRQGTWLVRTWNAWVEHAVRGRHDRQILQKTSVRTQQSRLWRAFFALESHAHDTYQIRNLVCRCDSQKFRLRYMREAFKHWALTTSDLGRVRSILRRMALKASSLCLVKAWASWSDHVEHQKVINVALNHEKILLSERSKWEERLAELEANLNRVKRELEDSAAIAASGARSNELLEVKLADREKVVKMLEMQVIELTSEVAATAASVARANELLESELIDMEHFVKALETRLKELTTEVAAIAASGARANEQLEAQLIEREDFVKTLETRVKDLMSEVAEVQSCRDKESREQLRKFELELEWSNTSIKQSVEKLKAFKEDALHELGGRVTKLISQIDETQQAVEIGNDESEQQVRKLEFDLESLRKVLHEARGKIRAREEHVEQLKGALIERNDTVRQLEGIVNRSTAELDVMRSSAEQCKIDLGLRLTAKEAEVKELQDRVVDFASEIRQMQSAAEKHSELEIQLLESRKGMAEATEKLEEQSKQMQQLQTLLLEKERSRNEVEERVNDLISEIGDMASTAEKKRQLESQLETSKTILREAGAELKAREQQVQGLEVTLAEKNVLVQKFEDKMLELISEIAEVRSAAAQKDRHSHEHFMFFQRRLEEKVEITHASLIDLRDGLFWSKKRMHSRLQHLRKEFESRVAEERKKQQPNALLVLRQVERAEWEAQRIELEGQLQALKAELDKEREVKEGRMLFQESLVQTLNKLTVLLDGTRDAAQGLELDLEEWRDEVERKERSLHTKLQIAKDDAKTVTQNFGSEVADLRDELQSKAKSLHTKLQMINEEIESTKSLAESEAVRKLEETWSRQIDENQVETRKVMIGKYESMTTEVRAAMKLLVSLSNDLKESKAGMHTKMDHLKMKLKKRIADEKTNSLRMLEAARLQVVQRMMHSQLAMAFDCFCDRLIETKRKRVTCKRVVLRMQIRLLAAAFHMLTEKVEQLQAHRKMLGKAVSRWKTPSLQLGFDMWVDYLDACRVEVNQKAHQHLQDELAKEKKTGRDRVREEKERRIIQAQRIVQRMLHGQLAGAFDCYHDRVIETKRKRETCKRAFLRMQNSVLAGAFDVFKHSVKHVQVHRRMIEGAVTRWKTPSVQIGFDMWMEYLGNCKVEAMEEARQQLKARIDCLEADVRVVRSRAKKKKKESKEYIRHLENQVEKTLASLVHLKNELEDGKVSMNTKLASLRTKMESQVVGIREEKSLMLEAVLSEFRTLKGEKDVLQAEVIASEKYLNDSESKFMEQEQATKMQQARADALQAEIETIERERDSLQAEVTAGVRLIENLDSKLVASSEALDKMQAEVTARGDKAERLETQLQLKGETVKELETRMEELTAEVYEAEQKRMRMMEATADLQEETVKLLGTREARADALQLELAASERLAQDLECQVAALTEVIDIKQKELNDGEKRANQLENLLGKREEAVKELEMRAEQLLTEVAGLRKMAKECKHELHTKSIEKDNFTARFEEMSAEVRECMASLVNLNTRLEHSKQGVRAKMRSIGLELEIRVAEERSKGILMLKDGWLEVIEELHTKSVALTAGLSAFPWSTESRRRQSEQYTRHLEEQLAITKASLVGFKEGLEQKKQAIDPKLSNLGKGVGVWVAEERNKHLSMLEASWKEEEDVRRKKRTSDLEHPLEESNARVIKAKHRVLVLQGCKENLKAASMHEEQTVRGLKDQAQPVTQYSSRTPSTPRTPDSQGFKRSSK